MGRISFMWLKTTYSVVPPGIEEDDRVFLYYVRAYVLYVIGAVVFPNSSDSYVSANYLLFLEDIEKFDDYAWGAGMLAQLLGAIKCAKMKGLKALNGADWLLQLFIMERLPSVAKTLLRVDGEYQVPTEVPYIVQWSAFLRVPSQYNFKGYDFHQKLVDAGQQIKWRPYVERNGMQNQRTECSRMFYSRTVLLGLKYLFYHRPELSPQQLGITEVDESRLRPLIALKEKGSTGPQQRDWPKVYNDYIVEWNHRHDSCVIDAAPGTDFVLPPMPQEAASTIPQTAACGSCSATAEALQTDTCLGSQPTRNVAPDAEMLSILRDKTRGPRSQITSSQEATSEDEIHDDGMQGMRHAKCSSGGRKGDHERAGCESHVIASVSMTSTTTHIELQSIDGKANSGEKRDEPIHDNPKNGQSAMLMQVEKNNQSEKLVEKIELSDDEDQDMNIPTSKPTSENLDSRRWYCLSPTGRTLGPFFMSVLKEWYDTCANDLGFKIWSDDQNPEEAVFLSDAIHVKKRKIK